MNYPSIGQYTETIKLAAKNPEDYFDKLSNLHPVLDANGDPIMSSGNFAVVFKMYNPKNYKYYALKCFHREQEGREQNYQKISEELNRDLSRYSYGTQNLSSSYFLHVQYYEKEMFVDIGNSTSIFPVLLMEWVDGITLDKYVLQNMNNPKLLQDITYRFSRMAKWLLSQRFAHGDLKPDNILVRRNGQIVLVDYDGMYVPSMKGQKALELGSPNFRHPGRTEDEFDGNIDDFSIIVILLSLKAISLNPELFSNIVSSDRLLFCERDYQIINENKIIPLLNSFLYDSEIASLLGAFLFLLYNNNIPKSLSSIINIQQNDNNNTKIYSENQLKEKMLYFLSNIDIFPPKIVYLIPDLFNNDICNYWLPQNIWKKYSVRSVFWDQDEYKSMYSWAKNFDSVFYSVDGEFSKKSRYNGFAMSYSSDLKPNLQYLVNYMFEILDEMGVSAYFADNVDKLIEIIRSKNKYGINTVDLPF